MISRLSAFLLQYFLIKSNLAESQDKDFKIANMNMLKDLKEGLNKHLNENPNMKEFKV